MITVHKPSLPTHTNKTNHAYEKQEICNTSLPNTTCISNTLSPHTSITEVNLLAYRRRLMLSKVSIYFVELFCPPESACFAMVAKYCALSCTVFLLASNCPKHVCKSCLPSATKVVYYVTRSGVPNRDPSIDSQN